MGERGDIIKTIHKTGGGGRPARSRELLDSTTGAPSTPIVGRVIDKHLSDELGKT